MKVNEIIQVLSDHAENTDIAAILYIFEEVSKHMSSKGLEPDQRAWQALRQDLIILDRKYS